MTPFRHASLVALALVAGACNKAQPTTPAADATPDPLEALSAEVDATVDRSADPCDDFYQFACGGWESRTELPADKPRYSRSFTTISDKNRDVVRGLLDDAAAGRIDADPRLGAFYGACQDVDALDALGAEPLKPWLDAIQEVKDGKTLMRVLGTMSMVDAFASGGVYADFDDPGVNVLHVAQGGLGLPNRDYYFPDDEKGEETLAAYRAHVGRMLELGGVSDWASVDEVMAIESRLAEISRPPEALRDPSTLYHKIDREGLQGLTPSLPWNVFFKAAGAPELTSINVQTPEFFEEMEAIAKEGPWDAIQAYLAWRWIDTAAGQLGTAFDEANFDFYGKTLSGQQEQEDRWKRCVQRTDGSLGDLLGQAYVDVAFPGDSKKIALDMIKDIEAAFEAGLPDLAWMDEATRAAAVDKVRAITNKIGYPDKWESYEGVEIGDNAFDNWLAIAQWAAKDDLAKAGQPVDRSEWFMTPPTVNAYYNPLGNEIVFPAGILQPPFFSADFPRAMNYGAMGMVMGHEITHGFDDSGRQFAPDGALKPWWGEEAVTRFEEAAGCVEALYDGYEVLPGVNLNGKLTLGENIADLGGIKLAHRAYMAWLEDHEAPTVAGFTPEQQVFVGYAQGWCTLATDELVRQRAKTDPHSHPKWRVNGPLSQLPAFAEAFDCPAGSPMRPEEICEVW